MGTTEKLAVAFEQFSAAPAGATIQGAANG